MKIIKKRTKSHKLLAHEALFRRLQVRYRNNEKLLAEYLKYRAGFYGEKNLDYKLSLFPHKEFLHYPDLRLQNFMNYFQMDSIILTPKVIFILEAKNIRGILEYDGKLKQFIQITDEKTTSYKDPILQAETQKKQLSYWLEQRHIPMPIETLIVSTNQSAIIRNVENDDIFNHRFVTLESLLFKLEEIYQSYSRKIMNLNDLHTLYKKIYSTDEPAQSDLLHTYKIDQRHLVQGIFCEVCQTRHYIKRRYDWICPQCNYISNDCHERVVLDYFLLNGNIITNEKMRELLMLSSSSTSKTLLHSMNLRKSGENRGRVYHAPLLAEFPQDAEPTFARRSILEY